MKIFLDTLVYGAFMTVTMTISKNRCDIDDRSWFLIAMVVTVAHDSNLLRKFVQTLAMLDGIIN